jgi:hypothetical protein
MRLNRNPGGNLFVERHPARCAAHARQQLVVESFPAAKPAAAQIKGHAGHEHEVKPV